MLNKLKWYILGILSVLALTATTAYALSVSLPTTIKKGDLLVGSSTNSSLYRLATSTLGSVLWMNSSGLPAWTATSTLGISGSGGTTPTIIGGGTATGPAFTFASTTDTNLLLSIFCATATCTFTPNWTGTLAAGRLNSNVVQGVTNDTNVTGSISAQNLTLGWTGTLADGRIASAGTWNAKLGSYNVVSANGLISVSTTTNLATLTASTSPTFTNGQFTGTLGVTGQTTLATASSTGLTVTGGSFLQNATLSGTLNVTGQTTLGNASTSALTVSGNTYLTGVTNTFLATDPSGKVIATTTPAGGSGCSASGTAGSIQFSNGSSGCNADQSNFWWDNTNKRLGIGTSTPQKQLELYSNVSPMIVLSNPNAITLAKHLYITNDSIPLNIGSFNDTYTSSTTYIRVGRIGSGFLVGGNISIGVDAGPLNNFNVPQANGFKGSYANGLANIMIGTAAGLSLSPSSTCPTCLIAYGNTAVGTYAAMDLTTGVENDAFGINALTNLTTGNNNEVFGVASGFNITTGLSNTIVGGDALGTGNTNYNSALGYAVFADLGNNQNSNTGLGQSSAHLMSTGQENTFVGAQSFELPEISQRSVIIGFKAQNTSNSTNNTIIGYKAALGPCGDLGIQCTMANSNNVFLGYQSGFNIYTGSNNLFLGYQTGMNASTSANNILIGYQAGASLSTGSNNLVIGYNTDIASTTSNTLSIGNLLYGTSLTAFASTSTQISAGRIGIGTSTPVAKFTVVASSTDASIPIFTLASSSGSTMFQIANTGSLTLQSANTSINGVNYIWPASLPASNKVLQSDSSGNLSWVTDQTGGGGSVSGGINGYVATWASSTGLTTGILEDNGTVAGAGATTTGITFNVAGTFQATATSTLATTTITNLTVAQAPIITAFNSAGVVHNSSAGLLSSSAIVGADIQNSTIDLTTKVTGVLPIANGGTATSTAPTTQGQLLMADNTGTKYMPGNLVAGSNITITTTTAGSITITGSAGGSGNSAWTIGNGLIYNATSTDLVGIGTITPTTTLFVQGKGGTSPFTVASSTGTAMLTVTQNKVLVPNGSNLVPGIAFQGQIGVGFNLNGTGIDVVAAGSQALSITGSQLQARGNTTAAPEFSSLTSTNSGMTIQGTGATASTRFSTNAVERFTLLTPGFAGINSSTPTATLVVQGYSGSTTPTFIVSSSTGQSWLTVASNGSTTLSSLGTGNVCTSSGSFYNCTVSATLSGGTNGKVALWNSASTLTTGMLLDNGTVSGVNATSSTVTFNIQGSAGTNDMLNVASSSGTSILKVTSAGTLVLSNLASCTLKTDGSGNVTCGTRNAAVNILGAMTLPDSSGNVYADAFANATSTAFAKNLDFTFLDTATKDCLYGLYTVPKDYVSAAAVSPIWAANTATIATTTWEFSYRDIATGSSMAQGTAQETASTTSVTTATLFSRQAPTISVTAGNFTAGDSVQYKFCRDGTDSKDTMAATATLQSLMFNYAN